MASSQLKATAMKVIGVGWSRTGTMSLQRNLELHGIAPVWHGFEYLAKRNTQLPWVRDNEDKLMANDPVDWNEFFKGYSAGCDIFCYIFWKELSQYYPQSKIILTKRDPEKWINSLINSLNTVWDPKWYEIVNYLPRKIDQDYNQWFKTTDRLIHNQFKKQYNINIPGFANNVEKHKNEYLEAYIKHNDTIINYFCNDSDNICATEEEKELLKNRLFILDLERQDRDEMQREFSQFLGLTPVEDNIKLVSSGYDMSKDVEKEMNNYPLINTKNEFAAKCRKLVIKSFITSLTSRKANLDDAVKVT